MLIDDALGQLSRLQAGGVNGGDELLPRIVLAVIGGPHKGRKFDFAGHDNFIVGRARCVHFRLPKEDPYFSRFHFMVEVNPPRCRVVDLVNLNGTYVNGRQVAAADLHDGDEIRGGDTLLRVSLVGLGREIPLPQRPLGDRGPSDTTEPLRPPGVRGAGERSADEAPPAEAPAIPGFQILRQLGCGGMGVVYLVQRPADAAQLALKIIRPAFAASQREVQRFLRECQILCTLRHPHIVGFHQMGRAGDLLYFVMDYVPGTDAGRLARSRGCFSSRFFPRVCASQILAM